MRKAFHRQFTPQLLAELKGMGIDFDHALAAYPLDVWLKVVRVLAERFAADVPAADRVQHLGRIFMRGYVQTAVGMATLAAAKVMGLRRTLLRMGRNFRTAANYVITEAKEVGPKEVHIRTFIDPQYLPRVTDHSLLLSEYRQGVLQETLVLVGGKGTVDIIDAKPDVQDVTFRVRWD